MIEDKDTPEGQDAKLRASMRNLMLALAVPFAGLVLLLLFVHTSDPTYPLPRAGSFALWLFKPLIIVALVIPWLAWNSKVIPPLVKPILRFVFGPIGLGIMLLVLVALVLYFFAP